MSISKKEALLDEATYLLNRGLDYLNRGKIQIALVNLIESRVLFLMLLGHFTLSHSERSSITNSANKLSELIHPILSKLKF